MFSFCYERDFILSLSDNNQADVVEAFNPTSRYLDDLLNIDNAYFAQMVSQIYPTELQLFEANPSDVESKKEGRDQESIQSSTTPDPGYKWKNDDVTNTHHKREPRGQPFPSR